MPTVFRPGYVYLVSDEDGQLDVTEYVLEDGELWAECGEVARPQQQLGIHQSTQLCEPNQVNQVRLLGQGQLTCEPLSDDELRAARVRYFEPTPATSCIETCG